jgi:hypothetical protein
MEELANRWRQLICFGGSQGKDLSGTSRGQASTCSLIGGVHMQAVAHCSVQNFGERFLLS